MSQEMVPKIRGLQFEGQDTTHGCASLTTNSVFSLASRDHVTATGHVQEDTHQGHRFATTTSRYPQRKTTSGKIQATRCIAGMTAST